MISRRCHPAGRRTAPRHRAGAWQRTRGPRIPPSPRVNVRRGGDAHTVPDGRDLGTLAMNLQLGGDALQRFERGRGQLVHDSGLPSTAQRASRPVKAALVDRRQIDPLVGHAEWETRVARVPWAQLRRRGHPRRAAPRPPGSTAKRRGLDGHPRRPATLSPGKGRAFPPGRGGCADCRGGRLRHAPVRRQSRLPRWAGRRVVGPARLAGRGTVRPDGDDGTGRDWRSARISSNASRALARAPYFRSIDRRTRSKRVRQTLPGMGVCPLPGASS